MKINIHIDFSKVKKEMLPGNTLGMGISVYIYENEKIIADFMSEVCKFIDYQFVHTVMIMDSIDMTREELSDTPWVIKKLTQHLSSMIIDYGINHLIEKADMKDAYREVMMYSRTMAIKIHDYSKLHSVPTRFFVQ